MSRVLECPRVSVVMPAYNVERFIAEAIESVLGQTFADLELIVVDDGSTDATPQLVERFVQTDARVRLIAQANSGRPGIARNRGIAAARGAYLTFLDSDDYWYPQRLGIMISGLEQHQDWVAAFHDLKLVGTEGDDLGQTYLRDASFLEKASPWLTRLDNGWWDCTRRFFIFMSLYFTAVHTQSIVIARSRLPSAPMFNPDFIICEDIDLWIQIACLGKIGFLDEILSAYRQHGASIIRNRVRFASETLRFHQHNHRRLEAQLDADESRRYRAKIANCHRELAYQHYREDALSAARKQYLRALRMNPRFSDAVAIAKTFLPPQVLQFLRGADG